MCKSTCISNINGKGEPNFMFPPNCHTDIAYHIISYKICFSSLKIGDLQKLKTVEVTVVMCESIYPVKYGFMDYLLSHKQTDKAFLWEISLIVSRVTSPQSETISFTIKDKEFLFMTTL